jgi:hypothetical protein
MSGNETIKVDALARVGGEGAMGQISTSCKCSEMLRRMLWMHPHQ